MLATTLCAPLLLRSVTAQAEQAKVVALASDGNDTVNAIKQGGEFGLHTTGQRMTSLLTFITDIHAFGLKDMQGLQFVVPSYRDYDDRTRVFAKRHFERMKKMRATPVEDAFSRNGRLLPKAPAS